MEIIRHRRTGKGICRLRDYSALRASPLRGRPSGVQFGRAAELVIRAFGPHPLGDACASSKIACGDFVEPHCLYLGFESSFVAARPADGQRQALFACVAEREGFEPSKGF